MAVYCYMMDCENRSKRKSKAENKRGERLYKCKLKDITITRRCNEDVCSYDSEDSIMENMSNCLSYRMEDKIDYEE